MSLVNLSKSVGQIRSSTSHQVIPYKPYEFSASMLGILSPARLEVGSFLLVDTFRCGTIPLEVMSTVLDLFSGLFRYRLRCPEEDVSLTDALEIDSESGRLKFDRAGSCLQFARFKSKRSLMLLTKTFGSRSIYSLQVDDLSRSGILTYSDKPYGGIPYIANTLLECRLILDGDPDQAIEPMGKVVRLFDKDKSRSHFFAIKFTEMDKIGNKLWTTFVDRTEETIIRDFPKVAA